MKPHLLALMTLCGVVATASAIAWVAAIHPLYIGVTIGIGMVVMLYVDLVDLFRD